MAATPDAKAESSLPRKAAPAAWTGGGWERNFHCDDSLLRRCGLWCKQVEADGACLFRAFSDQIEGDGGANHLEYRERCVTFLETHIDDFAATIDGDVSWYLQDLAKPTTWGGHIEVQALSKVLCVNVLIHCPADANGDVESLLRGCIEVVNWGDDAPCVQLVFHQRYHAGPHYNSVRFLDDDSSGRPTHWTAAEVKARMAEAVSGA